MMIKTLADMNRVNQRIWAQRNKHMRTLLERKYIKDFVIERFVRPHPPRSEMPAEALERVRKEKSFYAQLCEHEHEKRDSGAFDNQRIRARQPRRKAAGSGLSMRELVKAFASKPENLTSRSKVLWEPFFSYLQNLGHNPTRAPLDSYEYAGKRKRLLLTYRQFEKLVSQLVPRRRARL
jgi:hypothetical protein